MSENLTSTKIKKLISDPNSKIELHDLVHTETERLYQLVKDMNPHKQEDAAKRARSWMKQIEEESKNLRKIFAYGCFFGNEDQAYIWKRSLDRLGSLVHSNGMTFMLDLQHYPAMLVLYSGGVSAVSAGNIASLRALLSSNYQGAHTGTGLLMTKVNGWLIDQNLANQILELKNRKTPLSDHVFELLENDYPESLIVKDNLASEYDRFEVIIGMAVAYNLKSRRGGPWAPVGRFAWRDRHSENAALDTIKSEMDNQKSSWSLLEAGLCNGSIDDAIESHKFVREVAEKVNFF